MRDETYWENEGWRVLCNQTVNLCLQHTDEWFQALEREQPDADAPGKVASYIERIVAALSQRCQHDSTGLWPVALSLFGDTGDLRRRLLKDTVLFPDPDATVVSEQAVTLDQALAQKLRDYLNDMKRTVHPHRMNVWVRLDRISRSVFATQQHNRQGGRCTPEHFAALTRAIRERYPNDHNLPRTVETAESYFLEFCAECQNRFVDHELVTADELTTLIDDTDVDLPVLLHDCLQTLRREQQSLFDVINMVFRLGDSDIAPGKEAYRRSQGWSKRQLAQRQRLGIELLRDCIERKIVEA